MDTTWWAIDNDGHVAVFSSGEAGAVPEEAQLDGEAQDLDAAIHALPSTGFKFDPEGLAATRWGTHVDVQNADDQLALFMFLSDLVPIADLLARLEATPIAATSGTAVRVICRDVAALAELHARAACTACYRDWDGAAHDEIANHGVYRYDHTCENWISGPYARTTVPVQPLTIFEIPAGIRTHAVAFDGRFADALRIQPAEHWPCSSWEPGWLATDGKTARPFSPEGWGDARDGEDDDDDDESAIKFVDEPLVIPAPKRRWWK